MLRGCTSLGEVTEEATKVHAGATTVGAETKEATMHLSGEAMTTLAVATRAVASEAATEETPIGALQEADAEEATETTSTRRPRLGTAITRVATLSRRILRDRLRHRSIDQ